MRLASADAAALALGLTPGLTLADARARVPDVLVFDAEPHADARLIEQIADDCDRWTPLVGLDGEHALILDITGCASLFGGEAAMRRRLLARLDRAGISASATIAGTPDAARALARFGAVDRVPPGEEAKAVSPLSVAALGIGEAIVIALSRAGLKTIGDLLERPTLPVSARFGEAVPRALRRTAGFEDARIVPRRPLPDCAVERRFQEPIGRSEDIEATIAGLLREAFAMLERRGEGGRLFETAFFRTDGMVRRIAVELGRPSRDAASVLRLYRERLDALADPLDPGFGFDLIRVSVLASETLQGRQGDICAAPVPEGTLDDLVDRLAARFGRTRVLRFEALDRHDPARMALRRPAIESAPSPLASPIPWRRPEEGEPPLRPLRMFEPPQPIETLAEVPDGPPLRFRWRRVLHSIARAEGPERIAVEWWAPGGPGEDEPALTRDYYRVEDEEGRRFWLFRAGLYERETMAPRWFLHGIFA